MTDHTFVLSDPDRLAALRRYADLDDADRGVSQAERQAASGPTGAFERIVQLAADVLGVPRVQINLLDETVQTTLAAVGFHVPSGAQGLRNSFCRYTLASAGVFVSENARDDQRFQDMDPDQTSQFGLYAGAPLWAGGQPIGTLCVMDSAPRAFSVRERQILDGLALQVIAELELRLRTQELSREVAYAQALVAVGNLVEEDLSPVMMTTRAAELLAQAMDLDWAGLIELTPGRVQLLDDWSRGTVPEVLIQRLHEVIRTAGPEFQTGAMWNSVHLRRPLFIDDYPAQERQVASVVAGGVASAAVLPLALTPVGTPEVQAQVLVFLRLGQPRSWLKHERHLLESAARSVAQAYRRHQRLGEMNRVAHTDALTGLANRRAFSRDLAQLDTGWSPAQPGAAAYSVTVMDIDGLKSVNDVQGHARGDELLACFASELNRVLGYNEQAYRLGGDEFAVIGQLDPAQVELTLRLETVVERTCAAGFGMGVSAGRASLPNEADSGQQAATLADARMYENKRLKRFSRPVR